MHVCGDVVRARRCIGPIETSVLAPPTTTSPCLHFYYFRIPKSLLEGKLPDVQRKMTNEVFADRNSIRNDIKEIMSLRETLKTAATLRQNMSTMFRAMVCRGQFPYLFLQHRTL